MTVTDVGTATRLLDFKCSHCGYVGVARLRVSPEGATESAFARASLIIPCPDCEGLDEASLKRYRADRLKTLAIIAVPAVVGIATGLSSTDLQAQRIGWLFGLGFALCCLQPLAQMLRPPRVDVTFGTSAH